MTDDKEIDDANVTMISHIQITDLDSGKVILRQRDTVTEKKDEPTER